MLGSQMLRTFKEASNKTSLKIYFTSRKKKKNQIQFDVLKKSTYNNLISIKPNYIINCIGMIKPKILKDNCKSSFQAFEVNSLFPVYLSQKFKKTKIINISSNAVFDGSKGRYLESDKPSCKDIYGISKRLGEAVEKNVMNIRCSIIGFERNSSYSLLSWFLNNDSKKISGYKDQYWNGITTFSLSKICFGIIKYNLFRNGIFHIFTRKIISKYELLCILNKILKKNKMKINKIKSKSLIDMSLSSKNTKFILKLWKSAGYDCIPSIQALIKELDR